MIPRKPGLVPVCLSWMLPWLMPNATWAQTWDPGSRVLTFGQALERALASNAELAARTAELDATEARAQRHSLAAGYSIGMDVENLGLNERESTLRLARVIELGGKQRAREALGAADVARVRHELDFARRRIVAACRDRFIEVLADQRRLQMAREHVRLAARARDEVASAVTSARDPETDLHAAELALADAELELEHAEHELAAARVTLASIWGSRDPDFDAVTGALDELPAAASLETLAARLDQSPVQLGAILAAQTLAARRELARANARPDLNAALGVRRLEALGENALVMSVSMPLGAARRATLEVREAQAEADAHEFRRAQSLHSQYEELYEQYQELLHARAELDTLRERMLPGANRSLEVARRGFTAGRFPFLVLSQSQERLVELQRRQVEALVRYHQLWNGIELLAPPVEGVAP